MRSSTSCGGLTPRTSSAEQRPERAPVRLAVAARRQLPGLGARERGGAGAGADLERPQLAREVAQPTLEDELHALVDPDAHDALAQQGPADLSLRQRLEPRSAAERAAADHDVPQRLRPRLD